MLTKMFLLLFALFLSPLSLAQDSAMDRAPRDGRARDNHIIFYDLRVKVNESLGLGPVAWQAVKDIAADRDRFTDAYLERYLQVSRSWPENLAIRAVQAIRGANIEGDQEAAMDIIDQTLSEALDLDTALRNDWFERLGDPRLVRPTRHYRYITDTLADMYKWLPEITSVERDIYAYLLYTMPPSSVVRRYPEWDIVPSIKDADGNVIAKDQMNFDTTSVLMLAQLAREKSTADISELILSIERPYNDRANNNILLIKLNYLRGNTNLFRRMFDVYKTHNNVSVGLYLLRSMELDDAVRAHVQLMESEPEVQGQILDSLIVVLEREKLRRKAPGIPIEYRNRLERLEIDHPEAGRLRQLLKELDGNN